MIAKNAFETGVNLVGRQGLDLSVLRKKEPRVSMSGIISGISPCEKGRRELEWRGLWVHASERKAETFGTSMELCRALEMRTWIARRMSKAEASPISNQASTNSSIRSGTISSKSGIVRLALIRRLAVARGLGFSAQETGPKS
jgi:hypothetical protein